MAKQDCTYGFYSVHTSQPANVEVPRSTEVDKFEADIRAALGLAPIKVTECDKPAPEEEKPVVIGLQTKRSTEAIELINNAHHAIGVSKEMQDLENTIRKRFGIQK